MTRTAASIPVELLNPGQVFACLGFLEVAELLLGEADAQFEWGESPARFVLGAAGDQNPFEVALDFLATAKLVELTPVGYVEGGASEGDDDGDDAGESASPTDEDGADAESNASDASEDYVSAWGREQTQGFPSGEGDRNSLPIVLGRDGRRLSVSHWADGSSRESFKLYSGNRSARQIAAQLMVGLRDLWKDDRDGLLKSPLEKNMPLGGSFNFDARRAWTTIDAGFSPDQQKKNGMLSGVDGSPAAELLAAVGLEHARPSMCETHKFRYAVWRRALPPTLARPALAGADLKIPFRHFTFNLSGTKHSKITTFAREETPR